MEIAIDRRRREHRPPGISPGRAKHFERLRAERREHLMGGDGGRDFYIAKFGAKQIICGGCGKEHTISRRARKSALCRLCWVEAVMMAAMASSILSAAIRRGEIPPARGLLCVDCDVPANGYDHRDYREPLSVEPTCRSCNAKRGRAAPFNRFVS